MEFEHSEKVRALQPRVKAFMVEHIYPNEEELFAEVNEGDRWQPVPLLEELKAKARAAELWNLFLPESEYGAGFTNLEYAPLCEIMGRSLHSNLYSQFQVLVSTKSVSRIALETL